jgi:transcriptional/translational regulatory protein YebC/TACO1
LVQDEWFHANNQDNRTRIAQNITNACRRRGGRLATTTIRTKKGVVTIENDDRPVLLATLRMLDCWIRRLFAADAFEN